jgi:hypothetical protein
MEISLTAHCGLHHFACRTCGSPSITVPDEINDAAELRCASCGVGLGSWHAFKERTRQAILSEIRGGEVAAERASSDIPLDRLDDRFTDRA